MIDAFIHAHLLAADRLITGMIWAAGGFAIWSLARDIKTLWRHK